MQQQAHVFAPQPVQSHLQLDSVSIEALSNFGDSWGSYSPACYSDLEPELDLNWLATIPHGALPDHLSPGIVRAQTLPTQFGNYDQVDQQSPIPSIQVTSHDTSPASSPIAPSLVDIPACYTEQMALLQASAYVSNPTDYYADYLSPMSQPRVMVCRPSVSSSDLEGLSTTAGDDVDWSNKMPPTKRRHTTCSIAKPNESANAELGWMLNSPRTTGYLKRYFEVVHPRYPFVEFGNPNHVLDASSFAQSASPIKITERLLCAAIGAIFSHQSRDISARYVRHAMQLQKREDLDLFSSVSGVHCAMLLAVYLYAETQLEFLPEEDDVSHPDVNLWLWNCRITAACVDLGLHEWVSECEGTSAVEVDLYRRTFLSAWTLDREICALERKPRGLRAEDVDARLLGWIGVDM